MGRNNLKTIFLIHVNQGNIPEITRALVSGGHGKTS